MDHDPEGVAIRGLFDLSIDLLCILENDTTVIAASRSFEVALGWPPAELIGRRMVDYFHEDDLALVEAELGRILPAGEATGVVVRVRTRTGEYRWVQSNARADAATARIYVTATDITDRMALEESLRRHIHLEELVASIATQLIGTDPVHMLDEIEQSIALLAQAMGADRGHFLRGRGREDPTYVEWRNPANAPNDHVPAPEPEVQRWWREALRSGRMLRLDDVAELGEEAPHVLEALRLDGVRSLLHVPLPEHRGHWGFLTMVAVSDVVHFGDDASALLKLAGETFMTALAAREDAEALREVREELERRNQSLMRTNEELEGFAYAAAHDLKAPLSRVEMALSTTTQMGGTNDELLGVARRAATRMRQLIEDLLTFAAAGSAAGPASVVDLDDVLTQVLGDLSPVIDAKGVVVERQLLPAIEGHRALLGQLIQNVVGNAVKFTRPDVTSLVQIDASDDDGGVRLGVRDNGIGIPPEQRSAVFSVFTRLQGDEAYAGSGIGLATCSKVVQHHGGRIWIDDGIDGGVTVCIWLPRAQNGLSS